MSAPQHIGDFTLPWPSGHFAMSTPLPQDATEGPVWNLDSPELYLNRELTWLSFNSRVLHEAEDERTPLLERVKFLAITGSPVPFP